MLKCSLSLAPARTPVFPLPISNSSTTAQATAGFAAIADAEQLDQDLTRRLGWPEPQPDPEERYTLTDVGRRALAVEHLFGPWPTLAQADAAEVSAA